MGLILAEQVRDARRNGQYWGHGGAIHLTKRWYRELRNQGRARKARYELMRSYYDASRYAASLFTQTSKSLWVVRAGWCLFRAKFLSDKTWRKYGYKEMTTRELNQRSRIYLDSGRLDEARRCAEEAIPRKVRDINLKALVWMSYAEIEDQLNGHRKSHLIDKAYDEALLLLDGTSADTKVRLLRTQAEHLWRQRYFDRAEEALRLACEVAIENGLRDQKVNLEASIQDMKAA